MPKLVTTIPPPVPIDPVKKAREQIDAQRTLPPFAQLVRQQMAAHEAAMARHDAVIADLQAQIDAEARARDAERYQCHHLAAWLAGLGQQEEAHG